ncbi:MAG: MBL fold metallo-hydrolase [Gemmatimonadetes bacterium]|nr:MBL fold metallo-hydrolase [Gemmatimonadota bacterium]
MLALVLVASWGTACGPVTPSAARVLRGAIKVTPMTGPFVMTARGTLNQAAELQGSRPGASDQASFTETLGVTTSGAVVYEMELDRIDGSREWVREIHEEDAKTLYLLEDSVIIRLVNHPELGGLERLQRRIPARLLGEVAASPDSALRVIFDSDTARIGWTSPEGTPLTLVVGPDSFLHRVEYSQDLPAFGPTSVTWRFDDYRSTEAGTMPHRYSAHIGALPFLEMNVLDVSVDPSRMEGLTATPEGFEGPIEVDGSEGPAARAEMEEIGPGLYRVRNLRNGFHPLIVEFDEFVAVVDAPTGYPLMLEIPPGDVAPGPRPDWLSRIMRDMVVEHLSKPIQHVVLTHFHNDHAGGAPALAGSGVTVYTSPGDSTGVRRMLETSGSEGAVVQAVTQGERITDGTRTLDVIQIGPNPHTHEMLVAYLHEPETLFVSDLVPGATAADLMGEDLTPTQAFFRSWLGRTPFGSARLFTMHGTEPVDLEALTGG